MEGLLHDEPLGNTERVRGAARVATVINAFGSGFNMPAFSRSQGSDGAKP